MSLYIGTNVSDSKRFELDRRDLTTHAVCVGMTGSGKTGLCVGLLEEAMMSGTRVCAIDPKGDLTNLAFAPKDWKEYQSILPWETFQYSSKSREETSHDVAERWNLGRRNSGITEDIVDKYRECDFRLYTPGAVLGQPVNILQSLSSPSVDGAIASPLEIEERAETLSRALLSLVRTSRRGPAFDKDVTFLTAIILDAWTRTRELTLPRLVGEVSRPEINSVGSMPLEDFYGRRRAWLATALNSIVASPRSQMWSMGTPLTEALFTERPGVSVFSLAHLGDEDRIFVVSLILNEVVGWMRRQQGSHDLRAMLYMDEVAGYLPPNGVPATKPPMMTLLKQARAFGLGCVLASQNPVDIDYKALSNAGLWMVGRLTTKRDQERLLTGLQGADYAIPVPEMRKRIAGLKNREFVLASRRGIQHIHSRHTICYLRGPVVGEELKTIFTGEENSEEIYRQHRRKYLADQMVSLAEAAKDMAAEIKRLQQGMQDKHKFGMGSMLAIAFGGRFMRVREAKRMLTDNPEATARIRELQEQMMELQERFDGLQSEFNRLED